MRPSAPKNIRRTDMAYLRIANLKKSYRVSRTQKQQVLNGINVEFKRGEFVAVLGESGCGKSTFMNILGGLDMDYTGSIVIDGEFMKDYTEKMLDDYRKGRVGLIFQNYNLINHMTVRENIEVAMTMSNMGVKERRARTEELLAQVALTDYADKLPNQLSGGQRQRVAVARALANMPDIVLADEPTGALDKDSAEQIIQILKKIAESGKLVIVVTHSQKVASACSRIITIDDGVIKSDERQYSVQSKTPKPKVKKMHNIGCGELFKLAYSNIMQAKKRSLLVSIGMSIGIAAVILVFCLSRGITGYVNEQLAGSMNALQIQVTSESSISNVRIEDISELEGVDYVAEGNYVRLSSSYEYDGDEGYIMLLSSSYDALDRVLVAGSVCADGGILISEAFAENLYTNAVSEAQDLVGTQIDITFSGETTAFNISGVYEDDTDYADYACAYITKDDLSDMYRKADKTLRTNILYVYVEDTSYITAVSESIEAMGFTASRDDSTVETLLGYVDLGTKVLTGFALISIAVSAIMIFIVTYTSVVERTKEIGILRAVGGRRKDVTLLFILESAIIGAFAGLIAVAFSLFISIVANLIINQYVGAWLISLNAVVYICCFAASVAVGVGSGLLPAMQASTLDPAESLRSE